VGRLAQLVGHARVVVERRSTASPGPVAKSARKRKDGSGRLFRVVGKLGQRHGPFGDLELLPRGLRAVGRQPASEQRVRQRRRITETLGDRDRLGTEPITRCAGGLVALGSRQPRQQPHPHLAVDVGNRRKCLEEQDQVAVGACASRRSGLRIPAPLAELVGITRAASQIGSVEERAFAAAMSPPPQRDHPARGAALRAPRSQPRSLSRIPRRRSAMR
jgi:hypothetical protein